GGGTGTTTNSGGRLGDLLGGMFGGSGRAGTQTRPRRGADVETEATLSFNDAIDGTTVALRLTGEGACPTCHGTGAKSGTVPKGGADRPGPGQAQRDPGELGAARAVPRVPRPRPGGRRPLPDVFGQRARDEQPYDPGPHPRGRGRWAADPAPGQGCPG